MATEEVVATSASSGIRFGDTEISSVMLGDTEVESVYLGDKEVYSLGTERPENLALLMHLNGSLTDETGKNTPIIRTSSGDEGTATYNSDGKFKSSLVLNGTNCVQMPYNADAFGFTDQDWTVAAWVKRNTVTSGNWQMIFNCRKRYSSTYSSSGWNVGISQATGRPLELSIYTNYRSQKHVLNNNADDVLPNGVWKHLAVVKRMSYAYLFIDGKKIDTLSLGTITIYNPEAVLNIGAQHDSSSSDNTKIKNIFEGEIDEVIVVNGKALWTTDFTPPARAYK